MNSNLNQAFFSRSFVGWENAVHELLKQSETNYPPYNIIKIDEDHFEIELATAGFTNDEITIKQNQSELTVVGIKAHSDRIADYVHRGLSFRDFRRTFTLADYVNVDSANYENGMLKIKLIREVPEEKKPRLIKIT